MLSSTRSLFQGREMFSTWSGSGPIPPFTRTQPHQKGLCRVSMSGFRRRHSQSLKTWALDRVCMSDGNWILQQDENPPARPECPVPMRGLGKPRTASPSTIMASMFWRIGACRAGRAGNASVDGDFGTLLQIDSGVVVVPSQSD